jgi:hypothetical protein
MKLGHNLFNSGVVFDTAADFDLESVLKRLVGDG